ncbi:AI-2E family transporter [Melissospora conviva]|uniref:AI-2E family transporter n=1 Tax=Melissospora conviva TaxID=3388432 RepID=UPI003C218A7C
MWSSPTTVGEPVHGEEVRLSRREQFRTRFRRAYEAGRESVRRAERRADAPLPPPAAPEPPPPLPGPEPVNDGHVSTNSRDDADVPHSLRIAAAWSWRLIVIGVVAWGLIKVGGSLSIVMIPLAIALLLTALMGPAVRWLLRARFPRSMATALVVVTGLAAVIGTLTLVVNEFIRGLPDLTKQSSQGIEQIQEWLKEGPLHLSDGQLSKYIEEGQRWVEQNTQGLTSGAISTATTVVEVFTGAILVLFATFFFLRDGNKIWRFVVQLLPVAARWRVDDAGQAAWNTLVAYVRATVLVAFIDAVGIGVFLYIFDVPFALPLSALIFLSSFIPIIGATLSGAVAVLIALVDSGLVTALIILGVVIGVQQLEGNVLQPIIMGRAVAIHPLVVIVAVTSGVVLAGIVGALVAVPVIAVLNTAVRRLSRHQVPQAPPDAVVVAATNP